jgi:hypothetical protein
MPEDCIVDSAAFCVGIRREGLPYCIEIRWLFSPQLFKKKPNYLINDSIIFRWNKILATYIMWQQNLAVLADVTST